MRHVAEGAGKRDDSCHTGTEVPGPDSAIS